MSKPKLWQETEKGNDTGHLTLDDKQVKISLMLAVLIKLPRAAEILLGLSNNVWDRLATATTPEAFDDRRLGARPRLNEE